MNMVYRAYHAYSNLTNGGKPVSIIFGMPSIVNGLINNFHPDQLYIVWDGERHKRRLELCPNYKQGRRKKEPEEARLFYSQVKEVRKLFKYLGIKQILHPEMECDDYIYSLTKKFKKNKDNKITIVSSDKDFHQLLCSNVKIYNPSKEGLIHHKNLSTDYPYTVNQASDYLCLIGDDSDNITGYPGVGEVTAKAFFQQFSSIEEFLKSDKQIKRIDKEKLEKLYVINKEMIDLKLFHQKNVHSKIVIRYFGGKNPIHNVKKLTDLCFQYNIRMFLKPEFLKNYN